MGRWVVACLGTLLAVTLQATSAWADSTSWVATETTVEANATTQVYVWAFVGPTDFTVMEPFTFVSSGFVNGFLPSGPSISAITGGSGGILGNGFPDDGTVLDALFLLTGAENPRGACSVSEFPPCQPGVANVYLATIDWSLLPEGPGGELEADAFDFSTTFLQSVPVSTPTPEPSTLLLLGTGLIGLSRLSRRKRA